MAQWSFRTALFAVLALVVASTLAFTTAPMAGAAGPATGVNVLVSSDGPWIASLTGLDTNSVASVTYWIRDARKHWRSTNTVVTWPFQSAIDWWDGNNSGPEAVTAHVTLTSGRVLKDPGGWHWIMSPDTNPGGTDTLQLLADGSASATYLPVAHESVISHVDFWLRAGDDHWRNAGSVWTASGGTYRIDHLAGTDGTSWNGTDAALSIHVVWPNGAQYVDPVSWIWSDHFLPATPTPAPATPTPTPPQPAAAPPTATAPAPTARPVVTAPPPPPPTAAPPAGCYPLSNSGTCYQPGEFCRTSDHGATGRTASGEAIVCRDNNGWRWEPA